MALHINSSLHGATEITASAGKDGGYSWLTVQFSGGDAGHFEATLYLPPAAAEIYAAAINAAHSEAQQAMTASVEHETGAQPEGALELMF